MRKHKTPTEIKEALFACKCEHGGFRNMDVTLRSGIADALQWVYGEVPTETEKALKEGKNEDK